MSIVSVVGMSWADWKWSGTIEELGCGWCQASSLGSRVAVSLLPTQCAGAIWPPCCGLSLELGDHSLEPGSAGPVGKD